MFNITGDNINALTDNDLRTLVGLLCEADLDLQKVSTAGITYGEYENAKDGGLDVRVQLPSLVESDGFIPRLVTGFQVKKTGMSSAMITEEMRPKKRLRAVISELANANGAYIIVSSSSSTSDSALNNRKQAMKEALFDLPNASNLKLDFYDRDRIAAWVNCHPSLVLWVKEKIGRTIQGWYPFANWSNPQAEANEQYLLDEKIRLHVDDSENPEGINIVDGINALRAALSRTNASVRLAGLSGVGKTRLLQALFDERIGVNPLPASQVCYTDISYIPNPAPVAFAEQLRIINTPVILAVDNCPPELHKSLTAVCTATGSLVRLITIEHDIRENQSEETDVFKLESASIDLVGKIIQNRFKYIGQVVANTIAEFSGGNTRIALALANTVDKGETLATLKDDDLFNRLFYQRYNHSDRLLKSAEVCALVYSFDGKTTEDANSELKLLASLADIPVKALYRDVVELKRRDLVQQRGNWCAVLPHTLANRLARQALENIPLDSILANFEHSGSQRLLKSFSRRLSYLHDSKQAIEIAKHWLSTQGILKDVSNLNGLGITLLKNIAPVVPMETLDAIERAANGSDGHYFTSRDNRHFHILTQLLSSLAYDAELFERSASLLCSFAFSEQPMENYNSIRKLLKSLFFLRISGTHASAEQRLKVIEQLIYGICEHEQELAFELLDATLEASDFNNHHRVDFGARSRDHGYSPSTPDEIQEWFAVFINFATSLAISDHPIASQVKKLLAKKFRSLWTKSSTFDLLETMANAIITKTAWNEGWIAVRKTINLDANKMTPELLSRLQTLETLLKPGNLLEEARVYAFSDNHGLLNLLDIGETENDKLEQTRIQIGKSVAVNEAVFNSLLPELLTTDVTGGGLISFAQGLVEGCKQPLTMWGQFRNQLSVVAEHQPNYTVLCGFLNTLSRINPKIAGQILNEALSDELLKTIFPLLQLSVKIDERGVERLKQAINDNVAQVSMYRGLAWGGTHESINHESINDDDFCNLLQMLVAKPEGLNVAIDILRMRLHRNKTQGSPCSQAIISLGRELLVQVNFASEYHHSVPQMDYGLSLIAETCLVGEEAASITTEVCAKLVDALTYYTDSYLLENIARQQPQIFLDAFCDVENSIFIDDQHHTNLLSHIQDKTIMDWCEVNPSIRYPKIVAVMVAYQHNQQKNGLVLTPLFLKILDNAPDVVTVLNALKRKFRSGVSEVLFVDILEKGLNLILQLQQHQNPVVSIWAHDEEKVLAEEIAEERQWENERNRTDERFE